MKIVDNSEEPSTYKALPLIEKLLKLIANTEQQFQNNLSYETTFPDPPSIDHLNKAITDFSVSLSQNQLPIQCCNICSRLTSTTSIQRVPTYSKLFNVLKNHCSLSDHQIDCFYQQCQHCKIDNNELNVCQECHNHLTNYPLQLPKYSILNSLNYGCNTDVPLPLQNLHYIEELIIARGRIYGSILKVSRTNGKGAISYPHLKGHVVVVPQNPEPLLTILPRSELSLTESLKVAYSSYSFLKKEKSSTLKGLSPEIIANITMLIDIRLFGLENRMHPIKI